MISESLILHSGKETKFNDSCSNLFILVYLLYSVPCGSNTEAYSRAQSLGRMFVGNSNCFGSFSDHNLLSELLGTFPQALVCTCGALLSTELTGVRHGCQHCRLESNPFHKPYLRDALERYFFIHPSWTEWAEAQVIMALQGSEQSYFKRKRQTETKPANQNSVTAEDF